MKKLIVILIGLFLMFGPVFAELIKIKGEVVRLDRKKGVIVIDTGKDRIAFVVKKGMLKGIGKGAIVIIVLDEEKETVVRIEKVPPKGPM